MMMRRGRLRRTWSETDLVSKNQFELKTEEHFFKDMVLAECLVSRSCVHIKVCVKITK